MDSSLYIRRYSIGDHGAILLPADVEWRVLPRYITSDEHDKPLVDERITVVLQDKPNHFWPVIVKMSVSEAEQLYAELARVIAERRNFDGEPA